MPLVNVAVQHNTTLDEAKVRLEGAVADAQKQFGAAIRGVVWSPDRTAVVLTGPGVVIDLKVDAQHVHASGDIPLLGRLLGSGAGKSLTTGLKSILTKRFKALPQEPKPKA